MENEGIVWLMLFAGVVAYIASQRGRSGLNWFFISILISPLISFIILIAIPAREKKDGIVNTPVVEESKEEESKEIATRYSKEIEDRSEKLARGR